MRIAMIGTRGVPARYGGFESAVEEIGARLVERGHRVLVYCRNEGQTKTWYRGMRLVNLPAVRHRAAETLSHSAISVAHSISRARPDVAFVFNAANAPFLPALRLAGIPAAVHMDGLEWQRAKWAGLGARYYRWAERASVMYGDAVIADATGIAEHVRTEYGRESYVIPYGAPIIRPGHRRLAELGLRAGAYHLVVARFEPENHVLEIVDGYVASQAILPLVVVGSAPYSDEYTARVHAAAASDSRVRFLGGVWDQKLLDQLYAGALSYLHGHSVGGTNPSLLRAMGAGASVTAHDNVFNREVTGGNARFFADSSGVLASVMADEKDRDACRERGTVGQAHASERYRWDDVTDGYEHLARRLAAGQAGNPAE